MQNTKILEMINDGQIEELKALIQDEIFTDELKSKPGAKQRYAAMKKYFSYTNAIRKAFTMPCVIDFEREKYTSFINGCSLALTKEKSGEMELFNDSSLYFDVEKVIQYRGEKREVDFNKVMAEAKSKGYKLKKSEVEIGEDFKYLLRYDNAYFKIGLLDATYRIINDGEKAMVWHLEGNKTAPMIIKNKIGVCLILPFNYNEEKNGVTVIEVA